MKKYDSIEVSEIRKHEWVDAYIAQELYESLKELVEEADRIEGLGLDSQWPDSPMRNRSRDALRMADSEEG